MDFRIHAHELPDYAFEGLLGIDFLERFNFEVRMSDRQIRLEPIDAGGEPIEAGEASSVA